jgi:transcriptional regulator with XRE-family HTH domain
MFTRIRKRFITFVTIKSDIMKDRLLQFLNQHNLTSTRLADEIGVQRSSISHILSGRNKPSYDFIYKFLQHYKSINPQWLILGEGSMYLNEKQGTIPFEEKSPLRESPIQKEIPTQSHREKSRGVEESPDESQIIEKIVIFYTDNHFEEYHPKPKK